jgi:hypothetical protein
MVRMRILNPVLTSISQALLSISARKSTPFAKTKTMAMTTGLGLGVKE